MFVIGATGQAAEVRVKNLPTAWVGQEVDAVTSWVGWDDDRPWIDAVHVTVAAARSQ